MSSAVMCDDRFMILGRGLFRRQLGREMDATATRHGTTQHSALHTQPRRTQTFTFSAPILSQKHNDSEF